MTDTKHPAEVLADDDERLADLLDQAGLASASTDARCRAAMLRRIPALEAERGVLLHAVEEWRKLADWQSARLATIEAEREALRQDWNRFHHFMKKHGLHPGRTDDDLLEILDRDMEASNAGLHHLRKKNVEARAERDALRAEVERLRVDAARIDWLAARLIDVEIDGADPLDHFQEGDDDDDWPKWWRSAIDAARGKA